MSCIAIKELNIQVLQDLLKAEKQNNIDLQTENDMLKKSLEFYKGLAMKLSRETHNTLDEHLEVEVKRRKKYD